MGTWGTTMRWLSPIYWNHPRGYTCTWHLGMYLDSPCCCCCCCCCCCGRGAVGHNFKIEVHKVRTPRLPARIVRTHSFAEGATPGKYNPDRVGLKRQHIQTERLRVLRVHVYVHVCTPGTKLSTRGRISDTPDISNPPDFLLLVARTQRPSTPACIRRRLRPPRRPPRAASYLFA